MIRSIIAVAAVLILAGAGLSKAASDSNEAGQEPMEKITRFDDYRVYTDLLLADVNYQQVHVIAQVTRGGMGINQEDINSAKENFKKRFGSELDDELIENFFEVNSKPKLLQDKFDRKYKVVLLSEEQSREIFRPGENGWKKFYELYPGSYGLTDVSAVAFNAFKTKALVYYGHIYQPLAGAGFHVLMVKQGDKWVVKKKVRCWVS